MATSGRINTGSGNGSYFYLQWQLAGQDVTGNTSTINWQAGIHISGGEYWLTNAVRIDGGNVDYAGIPTGTWSNVSGAGDHQLRSGTITIGHNADGTRNFGGSINGWLYSYGNRSTSGAWDLPTIPRATQPSVPASFDVGTTVTISLPRASGSFTHTVKYSFNGQSGTIATGAGTSATWNVPTALANTRPNNTSGTGTITVDTYNGGTYIGTKSVGFTATIPNTSSFQPTISNLVVEEGEPTVASRFSMYIQGKSKLHVTFDAAGVYGSTIAKHVVGLLATTDTVVTYYEGNDITTDVLAKSDDYFLTAFPVDSRNRTSTIVEDISVAAYNAPAITTLSAIRTDSGGVANDQGAYVLVTMGGSVTALSGENTVAYTLQYKKTTDSTWTSVDVTPVSGYDLSGTQLLSGIDVDHAYDIQLQAADYFTTTVAKTNVPTAFTTFDVHSDGTGIAFGKVSDTPGRLEVGPKMPAHIITDTTSAEDHGFMRLRRSDDTVLGFISTGAGGTGININTYDHSGAWAGKVSISETGGITVGSGAFDATAASSVNIPALYANNLGGTNSGGRQTVSLGATAAFTGVLVSYTSGSKAEVVEVRCDVLTQSGAGCEVYIYNGTVAIGSSHYSEGSSWEMANLSGIDTIPANTTRTYQAYGRAATAAMSVANANSDKTVTYRPQIYVKKLGTS